MANVLLENVSKRFPDGTVAVDDLSLEINDREFLVLVGPSGCGKSTALRLIAGLEACTSGDVKIGDCVVTRTRPKDRCVSMVFQNYALYPNMSVYKNMTFGLSLRNLRSGLFGFFGGGVLTRGLRKIFQPRKAAELAQLQDEIDNQVRQAASRLGIEHLLNRKPHQLSGGERQRVALGRAIVRRPAAFLFDEPLSNLDANLRQQMRGELKQLHRNLQTTMIYVTHDQVEAMTLGDRVAVMNEGKVLQIGKPLELYRRPANLFVAKFIGSVPINLCWGTVTRTKEQIRFEHDQSGGVRLEWGVGTKQFEQLKTRFKPDGSPQRVVLGFRAEDAQISNQRDSVEVEVTEVEHLGDSSLIHLAVGETTKNDFKSGDNSRSDHASLSILVRHGGDSKLRTGDRVNLSVKPDRVLWFDPETGKNLVKE